MNLVDIPYFLRLLSSTLSLVVVAAVCACSPSLRKPTVLDDEPILKYLKSESEGIAKSDNAYWQNGGYRASTEEMLLLPSGGIVEQINLEVNPTTKLMLLSWTIDSLTNTYEPGIVPPSYKVAVWTEANGWQMAKDNDGKYAVICGDLESLRTRNGQSEYGFRWYGRGRGAKPGVDVYTVVNGELQLVDSNRRDLDEYDGDEPPPAKDLSLTNTTFKWEWNTLHRLVNGKPWQKISLPRSKEDFASLVKVTPYVTKKDVLTWLAAQNTSR